jgi:hypothetical protein
MDAPPPGFVRVVLVCRACGEADVCDLQPRATSPERLPAVWRCFACGERAEPPECRGQDGPGGGPGGGPAPPDVGDAAQAAEPGCTHGPRSGGDEGH